MGSHESWPECPVKGTGEDSLMPSNVQKNIHENHKDHTYTDDMFRDVMICFKKLKNTYTSQNGLVINM